MQRKHAAHPIRAAYRRFALAIDAPMSSIGQLFAGFMAGFILTIVTMYCYFG